MLYNVSMRTKKKTKSFGVVEGEIKETQPSEEDKLIQDFTKFLYYQKKQRSNLLGDFADGEYDIRDERILKALLKLPKKFENQEGDSIYASTKLDDFVLNFRIDIDVSYSYCDARIWFIEIESDAIEDIKHTTQLDRVVEIYSQEFRQNTLDGWNVYYDDQQIEKDEFLKNLLRHQHEEFLFNQELVAILSQLYLLKMLKFLDTLGEDGEKLKMEYRKLMEEKLNNNPALSQDFAFQKEILDYVLMKHNALPEILKTKAGKEIVEGYLKPISNIKDKKFETITEDMKKEKKEKKADKAPSSTKAKVKAGGSKSVTKPSPKIDLSKVFGKDTPKSYAPSIIVPYVEPKTVEKAPVEIEIPTPELPPRGLELPKTSPESQTEITPKPQTETTPTEDEQNALTSVGEEMLFAVEAAKGTPEATVANTSSAAKALNKSGEEKMI